MEPASLEGAEVPLVKNFLKSPQKSGRELLAELKLQGDSSASYAIRFAAG